MAQYGKSLYGSSLYGYEGTLGGQYTGPETVLDPVLQLTGNLDIIADWYLPEASYLFTDSDVFSYDKAYTLGTSYVTLTNTSSNIGTCSATFVGEGYSLSYLKGASFGKMKVTRLTYVGGTQVDSHTQVIDTNGTAGTATFTETTVYGTHYITITHDTTSATNSIIRFASVSSRVSQIFLDVRTCGIVSGTETWGEWTRLTPTLSAKTIGTYRYDITGTSPATAITNKTKYQFKYTLLSSDTRTHPGIVMTELSVDGANGLYAKEGTLEVLVDLKEVSNFDSVDITEFCPISCEITTQSCVSGQTNPIVAGNIMGSLSHPAWSNYAVPYKAKERKKIWLKSNQTPVPANFHIYATVMTPPIDLAADSTLSRALTTGETSPLKFTEFTNLLLYQSIPDSYTSITYYIYDDTVFNGTNINDTLINAKIIAKASANCKQIVDLRPIGELDHSRKIRVGIRLDVNIVNNNNTTYPHKLNSVPAVSFFDISGLVTYSETKRMGTAENPSYGSAVYGNNMGNFYLTGTVGQISNGILVPSGMGYNIPKLLSTGILINPKYRINPRFTQYKANDIKIYWDETTMPIVTSDPNAQIYVEMRALPDYHLGVGETAHFHKHYLYGKGSIMPGQISNITISGGFRPTLTDSNLPQYEKFSYYLVKGWQGVEGVEDEDDDPIDISWDSLYPGIGLPHMQYVTEDTHDTIRVFLADDAVTEPSDWDSGEILSDPVELVVVNNYGDTELNATLKSLTGSQILDIPSYVHIATAEDGLPIDLPDGVDARDVETPYRVSIIERSIIENGSVIDNQYVDENGDTKDVITATVHYTNNSFIEDTVPHTGEYPIEMKRGKPDETDLLPHSHVIQINGIMRNGDGNNDWIEDKWTGGVHTSHGHYTLASDKKSIDWSPSYDDVDGVLTVKAEFSSNPPPEEGDTYYVSFKYYKLVELELEFLSPKAEKQSSFTAWDSKDEATQPEIRLYHMPLYEKVAIPYKFPIPNDTIVNQLKTDGKLPDTFINSTLQYYVKDDNQYIESSITNVDNGLGVKFVRRVKNPVEDIVLNMNGGSYLCQNKEYMVFNSEYQTEYTVETSSVNIAREFNISPLPVPGTAVVLQKQDGTPLRYVSFLEDDMLTYTIYNSEKMDKPTTNEVFLAFDDIDNVNNPIEIWDSEGHMITDTVTLSGRKLTFSADHMDDLTDQIIIKYVLKDSFTFNVQDTLCVVKLSEMPEEDLVLSYHPDLVNDKKVLWWLKFNHLYNHMRHGFIYVTQTKDKLDSFFIQVSPDCILRNGNDYAIITIDLRDKLNNPVSNIDLTFQNILYGKLRKIDSDGISIEGRCIYQYTPDVASGLVDETITVLDNVSGLSATFKIKLK